MAVNRSKIARPVLSGALMPRPHLDARLDRGFGRSLTLISAPAGHGKTSTIVDWLNRRGHRAVWMAVDRRDRDFTRFATHIAAALEQGIPGISSGLFALLTTPDRLAPSELGETFGEALYDLGSDLLLVLDDLHAAESSAVSEFVTGLLLTAPRQFHLVISTRHRPPIHLSRLRTMGDVEELTGAELRFSVEETSQVLAGASSEPIAPVQAEKVHAAVGGWPAIVRLIALSGNASSLALPRAEADGASVQVLRDYLGDEVLTQLLPAHRDLLLRVSLVERFNVPLMQSLAETNGGASIGRAEVNHLRALDLFREVPGLPETWFAYHSLFREILSNELERTHDPSTLVGLRRDIARWFAAAGMTREAVQHLVAVGDIPEAAVLIESRLNDAFAREEWQAISSWLRLIPREALLEHPELLLASGWVAYLSGREGRLADVLAKMRDPDFRRQVSDAQRAELALLADWPEDDVEAWIAIAEDAIARIPTEKRYRLGYAHMVLGMALTSAGREDEALARLSAFTMRESTAIDAASIRGYFGRVNIFWQTAHLARCEQVAADQLQLAAMNGLPVAAGWAAMFLAASEHLRGDLVAASRHLAHVIKDADRVHFMCLREAFFTRILIFEAQGLRDEADRAVAHLRELAITSEASHQLDLVDSFVARTALIRGDLAAARRWLETSPRPTFFADLRVTDLPDVTRVICLVAVGTEPALVEASQVIADFVAHARSRRMALALIEGLAVQAMVHDATGDAGAASSALRESLDLAAPEGIVQRFAYLGPAFAPLLRRFVSERAAPSHARMVLQTVEAVIAAQPDAKDVSVRTSGEIEPLVEPLTEREVEVIRLLAERLSNIEIGRELFISPFTVKNHVAHIYEKLGVSGRRLAVERAGALGLLATA